MISVILPVYRNTTLVEYCLETLLRRLPSHTEVIVVDDASGSDTIELLKRFDQTTLIVHEANRGNTAAYNTGARAARGDTLVFMDSDVLVPDGALAEFARVLGGDEEIGALGSVLLYPQDYSIQHAGVAFDRFVLSHLYVGRPLDSVPLKELEERQAVTAAFFSCRRAVYDEVGGFDETYRDGLEDIEFSLRCRELGYKNFVTSRVPALHLESASRGSFKSIRRTYNYSIFFSRWAGRFSVDLYDYVRGASELLRARSPDATDYSAPVVNFCTTPSWAELAQALRPGLRLGSAHDLSGFIGESDRIDLYRQLPLAFQRGPSPLVFVVDHFSQLIGNRHWFAQRSAADVVVDRHANVLLASDFASGSRA
jgi:GT2 family glycosyltransferase